MYFYHINTKLVKYKEKSMNSAKVSIIIPAYNAEKTIISTIESILNQTYNDIEIIIVDDASTDSTYEVCKKISQENSQIIKCYKNPKKGVSSARNYGLEMAQSEYIMFIDSDDLYKEEKLKEMLTNINEDFFDWIVFGYDRYIVVNEKSHITSIETQEFNVDNYKYLIEHLQNNCLFNQVWNKIYKNSIIKKHKIKFDEDIAMGEDLQFNLNYIIYSRNVKFINEIVYQYNSTSYGLNFKYQKNKMKIKLNNIKKMEQVYLKNNWNLEYIYIQYVLTCLSGIASIKSNKDKSVVKEELNAFIQDEEIHNEVERIKNQTTNKKTKIMCILLKIKNYYFINIYSIMLIFIKKMYRKIKFE